MNGFILGIKGEMEQTFNEKGKRIPTTLIHTKPCFLVDIITMHDAIHSVRLGFMAVKNTKKPEAGQLKKAGIETPLRFLKEVKIDKADFEIVEKEGRKGIKKGEMELYVGDEVKPSLIFKEGELVQVTGISKGKGFAGVVKRHKFAGGPRTHGQSDRERAPGSIGSSTTPGRVMKGKRMAGRMGGETVTVKNLTVHKSLDDSIILKGLIPGSKNSLVTIR
jgi:large subunit ribosomal protein L3